MSVRKIIISLSLVIISGCSILQPIDPIPEPFRDLVGIYKSISFTSTGPNDAIVDAQAVGGYVQMIIKENYQCIALYHYPKELWDGHNEFNEYDMGTFKVSNDTVYLKLFDYSVVGAIWDKNNHSLKSLQGFPNSASFILKKEI